MTTSMIQKDRIAQLGVTLAWAGVAQLAISVCLVLLAVGPMSLWMLAFGVAFGHLIAAQVVYLEWRWGL